MAETMHRRACQDSEQNLAELTAGASGITAPLSTTIAVLWFIRLCHYLERVHLSLHVHCLPVA
jgi:hypothetical protein